MHSNPGEDSNADMRYQAVCTLLEKSRLLTRGRHAIVVAAALLRARHMHDLHCSWFRNALSIALNSGADARPAAAGSTLAGRESAGLLSESAAPGQRSTDAQDL